MLMCDISRCGRCAVVEVAHDGAADDDAGAGRDTLQGAQDPQMLDARRENAASRSECEQRQRNEDDASPTQRVGQCAVPERHDGERDHVRGERLLHLQRRRVETRADVVERRQVGVDRERAERGEGGEQDRHAARREGTGRLQISPW